MPTIAPPAPPATIRVAAQECVDQSWQRQPRRRRRHPLGAVLLMMLVLAGSVLGISLATWGVIAARHGSTSASDATDPTLSDTDRAALGLPASVTTFYDPGAAGAVVESLDLAIAGPTRFTQISLYSDYAVAVAQDAGQPDHLDQYPWRSGEVGTSSPRPSTGDVDSLTFDLDEVDWSAISRLASSAVALTGVEAGAITHVIVDRSTFDASLPITIRIYVSGPRSSGFLEATAAGAVTAVY